MFSNTVPIFYFHSMVLPFLMTRAIAPEHDGQKNYPLFNRLGRYLLPPYSDALPYVKILYIYINVFIFFLYIIISPVSENSRSGEKKNKTRIPKTFFLFFYVYYTAMIYACILPTLYARDIQFYFCISSKKDDTKRRAYVVYK